MKTFVGLFLGSSLFFALSSVVYWFSAHDRAGSLLFGFMCCGLAFAGGYALLAEKNAALEGDDPQLQHKEAAGADMGIVTKESPWPFFLALSILWLFIGLLWSDFMIFTGLGAVLLCLWRLGAESARVGHERILTKEGPEDVT